MKYPRDLSGLVFARLLVIERHHSAPHVGSYWLCECECGKRVIVSRNNLVTGRTKSCGCLKIDKITTHGQSLTPLYKIWSGMIRRCENQKAAEYHNYGGRGISICLEWRADFQSFFQWAKRSGYRNGLTIDRINNDGNYEPRNCRWATRKEQSRNMRTNHLVTYSGATKPISEWSEMFGVSAENIRRRLQDGWPVRDALVTPVEAEHTARQRWAKKERTG
ncbi:hypothetical protein SAMN02745168_0607 [Papillibacter cinnamivorans DSM 12816]|uniref:AP2 domain-containing protein n=1 Tax=Papillibacter cinnamivorans DSM 12816 TaxID=1122930 RepID=A0A1W1YPW6_9FIRM|nr:hypothetical protein SAMN02745168_0607 [Papillibacter cinnamivorans DSM 12816]